MILFSRESFQCLYQSTTSRIQYIYKKEIKNCMVNQHILLLLLFLFFFKYKKQSSPSWLLAKNILIIRFIRLQSMKQFLNSFWRHKFTPLFDSAKFCTQSLLLLSYYEKNLKKKNCPRQRNIKHRDNLESQLTFPNTLTP